MLINFACEKRWRKFHTQFSILGVLIDGNLNRNCITMQSNYFLQKNYFVEKGHVKNVPLTDWCKVSC